MLPRIVVGVVANGDSQAFLQKLASMLVLDFDIVATAADGRSTPELIRRCKPDVTVFDVPVPVLNGIEVARELAHHSPRVVICSSETSPEAVEAALESGASAYVFKQRVGRDLILAVKAAILGKRFVSPALR